MDAVHKSPFARILSINHRNHRWVTKHLKEKISPQKLANIGNYIYLCSEDGTEEV